MQEVSGWIADLGTSATEMFGAVVAYLPSLLGALLLLLAGWAIARLIRGATLKLGNGVNRLLDRVFRAGSVAQVRLSPGALILTSNLAFWLIILFFITAATRVAELEAFSSWLDRIVAYLPTLLAGGLIILVGYLVSALARDVVSAATASAGLGQSELFGAAAQGATLLTAVVIGIDQIGVDVTFLVTILAIVIGAAFASMSLAFGLGARGLVGNLIGAHYLQRHYQPGQTARFGAIEGEILELTPTNVVLATAEGRMTIPAKVFNEETTVLVTPGDGHD